MDEADLIAGKLYLQGSNCVSCKKLKQMIEDTRKGKMDFDEFADVIRRHKEKVLSKSV